MNLFYVKWPYCWQHSTSVLGGSFKDIWNMSPWNENRFMCSYLSKWEEIILEAKFSIKTSWRTLKTFSISFISKKKLFGHSHHILHNKFPPFFIFSLHALSLCSISMCSSNKNLPIIIPLSFWVWMLNGMGDEVDLGGGLMEIGFAVHSLRLIPPHLFCVCICVLFHYIELHSYMFFCTAATLWENLFPFFRGSKREIFFG